MNICDPSPSTHDVQAMQQKGKNVKNENKIGLMGKS